MHAFYPVLSPLFTPFCCSFSLNHVGFRDPFLSYEYPPSLPSFFDSAFFLLLRVMSFATEEPPPPSKRAPLSPAVFFGAFFFRILFPQKTVFPLPDQTIFPTERRSQLLNFSFLK